VLLARDLYSVEKTNYNRTHLFVEHSAVDNYPHMSDIEDHEIVEESQEERERNAAGRYGEEGIVDEPDTDDNSKSNKPYGGDGVVSEPDTDDNSKSNKPYGGQHAVDGDADSDASP